MSKKLSKMSLEELWELFPIVLTEHKSYWKDWFHKERNRLEAILPMNQIVGINHIGSTAVDGIWAKPIIDILVEISKECHMDSIKELLICNGYLFAEKVYHLHLRYAGDHDELYFRDYLIRHPNVAKEYEKLKLNLWKLYQHNRDRYTDEKTEFISKYTNEAKKK